MLFLITSGIDSILSHFLLEINYMSLRVLNVGFHFSKL